MKDSYIIALIYDPELFSFLIVTHEAQPNLKKKPWQKCFHHG